MDFIDIKDSFIVFYVINDNVFCFVYWFNDVIIYFGVSVMVFFGVSWNDN